MQDLSPQYCLELLALPLHDPQRQRGLVLARKLAFEMPPDVSPLGPDRDAFLQGARALVTAQEYVSHAAGTCGSLLLHCLSAGWLLGEACPNDLQE